jgi:hypothetical protein
MADDKPVPPGTWTRRRRRIDWTLAYCAVAVVWLVERHGESAMAVQVVMALIGLAGAVLGSYVFGATWDDKNARSAGQ